MELQHTARRQGRLSSFLTGELRMSTGLMNKLKWGNGIRVNDIPRHTDYPVAPGDRITVRLEEPPIAYPAEEAPLDILYEDDHLLAVDKAPGVLIHPSRAQNSGTLANWVAGYYRRTGQDCAFHPVTRLDRDTFGIVLLAKHSHAHSLLQQTRLEKTYRALTLGGPVEDSGIIDAPIARRPLPSLLRFISPEGKPSQTAFRVLERFDGLCKLELRPLTGRTHQLRLHCHHMGYPILGDPQYNTAESLHRSAQLGLTHQLLCAKALHFPHPMTGEEMTLESRYEIKIQDTRYKIQDILNL